MSLTTRCKFVVDEITLGRSGSPTKLKLTAVYPNQNGDDGFKHDENHAFWNATPYGHIELHIQNPHGAEIFQPGYEFYVDFTQVMKLESAEA